MKKEDYHSRKKKLKLIAKTVFKQKNIEIV